MMDYDAVEFEIVDSGRLHLNSDRDINPSRKVAKSKNINAFVVTLLGHDVILPLANRVYKHSSGIPYDYTGSIFFKVLQLIAANLSYFLTIEKHSMIDKYNAKTNEDLCIKLKLDNNTKFMNADAYTMLDLIVLCNSCDTSALDNFVEEILANPVCPHLHNDKSDSEFDLLMRSRCYKYILCLKSDDDQLETINSKFKSFGSFFDALNVFEIRAISIDSYNDYLTIVSDYSDNFLVHHKMKTELRSISNDLWRPLCIKSIEFMADQNISEIESLLILIDKMSKRKNN